MRAIPINTRLVGLLLATLSLASHAPPRAAAGPASKEVYQKAIKGVVWLRSPSGTGSGWVVDSSARLIVTNHHVVGSNDTIQVYFPARKDGKVVAERQHYLSKVKPVVGKVIDSDPVRDLAVVQVAALPAGTAELKLAGEGVEPGDKLHCLGNPGASEALWVYNTGTVRQVYKTTLRYRDGQVVSARLIETQAPINPGDSGGPVLNGAGEVVGVTAAIRFNAALVNYCVDLSEVKGYLPLVRKLLNARTADDLARRAEHYAGRGRADRALADCNRAIKLDPRHKAAHHQRGLVLAGWGDFEKAAADFTKVIELDPKNVAAHHARALTWGELGRLDEALADFDKVLSLNANHLAARYYRGLVLHRKGEHDRAIADFTQALKAQPNNAVVLRARGAALTSKGEHDRAIADLTEAIRLAPLSGEGYLLRTRAYARKGEYAKAQADYATAKAKGAVR
jgi:tetratricopeptide (TPR) repeat protein